MEVCDDPAVRAATVADHRLTTGVLADAFATDPVWRWLLRDERSRPERLRRFFAIESEHVALRHGLSVVGGAEQGAALVLPPGAWRLPLPLQARHLPAYARAFGAALPRASVFLTAMERRHLREPHHYIAFIGVRSGARGQGLGEAMLRVILDRAGHDGVPCYLEASSPRSAALYARMGFLTVEEIRPLGSPPVRLMVCPPTGGPAAAGG